MSFHNMYVHIMFSSVQVAEWPPFGNELLTRLNICSLCILTLVIVFFSHLGLEGGIWDLIAPLPGHLHVLFTLRNYSSLLYLYISSDIWICAGL